MWLIFLFGYYIFGSWSNLQLRLLAKDLQQHNRLINAIVGVLFLLPVGILLGLYFPHDLDIGLTDYLLLIGGGFIWPLSALLLFRANKLLDAGVVATFGNISPVVAIVLGVGLLVESLSLLQLFASFLLVTSGLILAPELIRSHKSRSLNELLVGVLAATTIGVAIVFERFMLTRIDFGTYLIFGWGFQVLWYVIIARKKLPYLGEIFADSKKRNGVLKFGLLAIVRSVFFISALNLASGASIVAPAAKLVTVFTVLASVLILKEKDHLLEKILATVVGIIGLILISI